MPFFVYILRSTANELYVGQTNNLENREKQQVSKGQKAAKYIKYGKEFCLVYFKELDTRLLVMRRELQIKRWTRAKKEALIVGNLDTFKN
jgi:putative endonuclease